MSLLKLKRAIADAQALAAALPGNRALALVMTKLDEAELWLDRAAMTPGDRVTLEHFGLESRRRRLESALHGDLIPAEHRQACMKQYRAMSEYAAALVERMDLFTEGRAG